MFDQETMIYGEQACDEFQVFGFFYFLVRNKTHLEVGFNGFSGSSFHWPGHHTEDTSRLPNQTNYIASFLTSFYIILKGFFFSVLLDYFGSVRIINAQLPAKKKNARLPSS